MDECERGKECVPRSSCLAENITFQNEFRQDHKGNAGGQEHPDCCHQTIFLKAHDIFSSESQVEGSARTFPGSQRPPRFPEGGHLRHDLVPYLHGYYALWVGLGSDNLHQGSQQVNHLSPNKQQIYL